MKVWLIILSLLVVGCYPLSLNRIESSSSIWNYGDLRLLDPVDSVKPEWDLIALYSRVINQSFQLRIDILDLVSLQGQDIYIAIDTNPGGLEQINIQDVVIHADINWDYLIIIPATGSVKVLDSNYSPVLGMEMLINKNNAQDNIVIDFNKYTIPIDWNLSKIQVFITPPNQEIVVDRVQPISINAPSPQQSKVLFLFWDTFRAKTPAETLRSWAGAHSGPMSTRHGLKYLVNAAEKTKTTIFLLDMMTPENLAALDYLDVLPQISDLVKQGIIGLGNIDSRFDELRLFDNIPDDLINSNLNSKGILGVSANLDNNDMGKISNFFLLMNSIDNNNIFGSEIGNNDYAQFFDTKQVCLQVVLKGNIVHPAAEIPVGCKTLLLSNTLSRSSFPLLLGGDFNNSFLGDPAFSLELFSYIQNHPWIQAFSIEDLNSLDGHPIDILSNFGVNSIETNTYSLLSVISEDSNVKPYSEIYTELSELPENPITVLARQVFTTMTHPVSIDLLSLGNSYIGQIGHIIKAAKWVENPIPIADCNTDIDYDGENECILANNKIFLTIDPVGGYISFLFYKGNDGVHQIIGPSWELTLGMSDLSMWDSSQGVLSDPGQILGALVDDFDIWKNYSFIISENKVILLNENMTMRKSITITNDGILIQIQDQKTDESISTIPIVLDPWIRFTHDWGDKYLFSKTSNGLLWGIKSGISVEIISTNNMTPISFNETRDEISFPEDPDFDYSRGHYLPYPLSLSEIQSSSDYSVEIVVHP
jgi:hypothetical protein